MFTCISVSRPAGGTEHTLPPAKLLTPIHVNIPYKTAFTTVFLRMNP